MNTKFPLRLLLIILAIVYVHGATCPKNPLYTRHVKCSEFSQFFSEALNNKKPYVSKI